MASSSVEMSGGKPGRNSQATCAICEEAPSKYCCPRCEIFYCSVDCYKSEKHQNCSESFYRDCVNDELAGSQTDDESRNKMIEILKRMQKEGNEYPDELNNLLESFQNGEGEDDSDDDDFADLKDRLNGLNLNDADAVWGALTEDEKNEFEAILNQGDVGEIMPQWDPWWEYRREEKLVQDLLEKEIDDKLEEEKLKRCPEQISVPKLSSLTSVQPSPAIRSNITNVLASYAFLIRYFNGELEPVEGTSCMLNICANLDTNMNFEESALAVESVVQNCQKSNLIQTDDVSLKVMKHDTFMIIQGPSQENQSYYCRAALSNLHTIFSDAKKAASKTACNENSTKEKKEFSRKYPDHTREHLPKLDVGKVKKCIKKVEYYLAYVGSCGMELEE